MRKLHIAQGGSLAVVARLLCARTRCISRLTSSEVWGPQAGSVPVSDVTPSAVVKSARPGNDKTWVHF